MPKAQVRQEAGARGGWGAGLTEQMTLQIDERTADILRIMRANTRRTQGDLIREMIERALPMTDGYDKAVREYDKGRRVAKAPATGGRRSSAQSSPDSE